MLKKSNSTATQKVKDITLSIQFSLDGFSFCTINTDSKEKSLFKKYTFEKTLNSPEELLNKIKSIFKNDANLQQLEFAKVEVIHENNLSTLVPETYFDENSLNEYLKYNIKTLKNDFITFDEIPEIKAHNVYIPYVNINNYLFQNFGEFEYQHHVSILLKKLRLVHNTDKKVMYINVEKRTFNIIILESDKLILSNSFSYTSKEDFLYYILFVAETNQLNTEEFNLYFLGDITSDSELYKITYKYIKNILFLESKNAIYTDLKLPKHSNYILLG